METLPQEQIELTAAQVNDTIAQMESQLAIEQAQQAEQTYMNVMLMAMRWKDQEAARNVMNGAANMLAVSTAAGQVAMLEQQRMLKNEKDEDEDEE